MPDGNEIYKFLKTNNLTDKDEKSFVQEYSDPKKAAELHSFFVENKLTDKDSASFYDSYFKKKSQGAPTDTRVATSQSPSPYVDTRQLLGTAIKRGEEMAAAPKQEFKPLPKFDTEKNIYSEEKIRKEEAKVDRNEMIRQSHIERVDEMVKNTVDRKFRNENRKVDPNSVEYRTNLALTKQKVDNGDLVETKDKFGNLALTRPATFVEGFTNTLEESLKAPVKAYDINSAVLKSKVLGNDELISLLDKISEETPEVPESKAGFASEMLGGVVKPVALGSIPYVGWGAMVGEAGWTAYANQLQSLYQKGLSEGLSKEEAVERAKEAALPNATADAAVMGVMGKMGGAKGIAAETAAQQLKQGIASTIKSAAKVGGTMGAAEGGKAISEKAFGYDVSGEDILNRTIEGVGNGVLMDVSFKILHGGVKVPKFVKALAKDYLSKVPKEVVETELANNPNAEVIKGELENYEQAKAKVEGLVPEETTAFFAGKEEQVTNLKKDIAELEQTKGAKSEALAGVIDAEIKEKQDKVNAINKEIKTASETRRIVEYDNITGEEHVISDPLSKPKEEVSIPSEGEELGLINKTGKEKDLAGTEHAIATFNKGAFYPKETKVSERKNAIFQRDNNGQLEVYHLEKYETESGLQRFVLIKEGKEKPIAGIIVNSKNEIIQARSDKQGLGTKLGELVKNEIPNLSASGDISNQGLKFLERLGIQTKEQAPNSEVVSDVTKNIQDEIKTEAEKPIEQTDAGVPTSDELIASKEKSAIETEVGEAKSAASEWKAITEKEVKQAQAKYDAAKNRFEKTKKKVEEAQATQNNIFGGEQKGMFGMSGDEAKKTLNPLRKAAKEAKAELDDLQKRFEVQKTANEPELFTQKEYAQKDLDRAEAKKTHALVKDMPEPTDAEQIALRYIADGGKVSEQAINEVSGTVKRAKLNTSKRELKSTEARQRDYYLKDGETLDELAHRLWEKSNQDVSEIDIKDALMEAIGNHNTRLEASKAYLERYSPEYAEEQYYNKLAEQYADEHAKEEENIKKWLESEGEKRQDLENDEEHINQLIKQYEAEFKAENKQSEPTSEGKVTKKTSVGTSGKEDAAAKQKVTIRARDLATKLREGEANVLPDFLRAEIKGAKTSGATINEVFATALDTFADIYDKTEDFAKSVKEAATHIKDWYKENGKEYNEKELEDNLLNHFKEQLKTEETVPKSGGQEPPKPPIEESKGEDSGRDDDFDKLIHTTIESKEVRQTLSNAERVTGIESADETKDYNIQDRLDAIAQGESFIEKAKEKFGDEYVPRFLKYLEEKRGTLSTENYSLALLSLEVDLTKKAKADPSNLALAKQLEMVRGIVFKNQRSAARATGYGIIRDIALNGFSAREEMANQLLTTKERELKKKIEEALYADAETIQKEAESKLQEQEDTITLTAAELEAKVTEAAAKLRIEERRAERVEKKEKVHKAIDDFTEKWISKLSVKGAENLKSQGADIRTVMTAAAKAMKKAYDLGLETKEAVQQAVDYISDKLGTNEWDKEAYKKEAAAQLGLEYKTKGKESQFRQEYKALETERNRQLAIVDKLQTELTDLQKGIRKKVESKEPVKDTPEIEALKVKIKEEKVKLAATDATIKRIATKEVELQRLQERLPKVKTERDKRILSEREVELQKQIDAEKKAIKEAAIANGGGRLDKAKERVKLRMDEIRKEIAEKERKAKEENKPLNGDLEYDRLLEQEASLKKLRDKYLPEEKDPFEKEKQREQVKDALVKDIVDLNEQINARERAPKKEKADYSNDEEIVKLKKLKADKQAILEEIDPAAVPKEKTIAEKIKQSENNVQSQIDAIQKEIANGERDLKSAKKNPLQSKKLEQLREQKKSLEALRDKYLPKTSDPFEQQRAEKAARTNLTKEIIELNRQIQKGQKDVLTETKSPESEGIEKLMQEKRARQAILEALDPTPKMFVEQALIEKGFGKKIKVKTNNGVEERNVLDWTKLTGEERNIENISKNVGEVLQDKGFTEEQGLRIQDKFIDEYNRLSTDVLEKSQNKLASLNKKIVTAEQRSAGKKLAELYNLGLFEKDPAQFEYLLSRAIGTSEISIDRFRAIGDIAKTFDLIHKQKFNGRDLLGISKGTLEKILEDEVQIELNKQLNSKGNIKLAVADSLKSVVNISQRYGLTSLTQVVGNVTSGLSNTVMSNISALQTAGKIPKAVIDRANSARRAILKDMIVNGEVNFGSSGTSFTNRTNIDAMLKNMTDSQVYHTIASVWGGKAALDGVDSFYKVKMTNVKLYQHAFKILTTKRVINGLEVNPMTKAEAQNFLVEKLTGQSFEDAVSTAREFIKKANESVGKVVFKENRLMVERLANDIVKTALVVDGVITEEMVTAAYKSALGLAERNLGQKANNWFSKNISSASGALEKSYNDAVKEKHYDNAALLQVANAFYKASNKYVSGGLNWVVMGAENTGLGMLSPLYNIRDIAKLDLTSEVGVRDLEKAFLYEGKRRDAFIRGAVGAATSAVITGTIASTVGIDDFRKWRAKNPELAKYTDKFTPMWLIGTIAYMNSHDNKRSDKGMPEFIETVVGSSGKFDKSPRLIKSTVDLVNGKGDKALQIVGEIAGSAIDVPVPWRGIRDVDNLIRVYKGEKPYKVPKTPKSEQGFISGASKGGSIDYFKSWFDKK